MKPSALVVLAILVLALAFGGTKFLFSLRKEPEKKIVEKAVPLVEVLAAEIKDIPIEIPSQGLVEPWRETKLAAEVGGRVKSVSAKLEAGSLVEEGEVLVEIEPADYLAAQAAAEARVAEATLAVANEEASAAQAKRDWERLNLGGSPTPLTLREPQLAAARANLAASQAALEKARNDVARTSIRAPFAARVRSKLVEVGTVLAPGTPVAELYSTNSFKIRLPVSVDDAVRVQLQDGRVPAARFFTKAGGQSAEWKGRILRTEGEIDRASRSLYFVGELDPLGQSMSGERLPVMPGLFLDAAIEGRVLEKVVKLPRGAIHDNRRVLVVGPDNILRYREIETAWADRREVYVSGGLEEGEKVCLTTVEAVVDGVTKVAIAGADANKTGDQPSVAPDRATLP